MNGTLWTIRPLMKFTSRDSRSSLATTTGPLILRAALIAAASLGRRSRAVYRGRDYCSPRCAQYAADGFPAPDPTYARKAINVPLRSWTVVAGPPDVAVGSAYYADVLARYFDAGYSRTNPTSEGFKVTCRGCQKEFASRGQRYCSPECGRRDRERQGNLVIMAEVGVTLPAKRCCAQCGARIPSWRNGRKVSSATRFCSDACAQKARRAGLIGFCCFEA
jgi:hypothetical protein